MNILDSANSAKLDAELMSPPINYKVEQLMELAGSACAQAIGKEIKPCKIIILCGPGNNGGDGLVCARHLKTFKFDVEVFCPKTNHKFLLDLCQAFEIQIHIKTIPDLRSYDFIVDAIFGFNFKGEIREPYSFIFPQLSRKNNLICIDIPSSWVVDCPDMQSNILSNGIDPFMGMKTKGLPHTTKCITNMDCLKGQLDEADDTWTCFKGYCKLNWDDGSSSSRAHCQQKKMIGLKAGIRHATNKKCAAICKPGSEVIMNMDEFEGTNGQMGPQNQGISLSEDVFYIRYDVYVPSGIYNGVISKPNLMLNGGGNPITFSVPNGSFAMKSLYATSVSRDGLIVDFKGYKNGTLVNQYNSTLVTNGPTRLSINFVNVDRIEVVSTGGITNPLYEQNDGNYFVFDNLVFCNIVN